MPEQFICDACHERHLLEMWCMQGPDGQRVLCMRCCRCPSHWSDDPGGRAVFDRAMTWCGLHASESRTRRHT